MTRSATSSAATPPTHTASARQVDDVGGDGHVAPGGGPGVAGQRGDHQRPDGEGGGRQRRAPPQRPGQRRGRGQHPEHDADDRQLPGPRVPRQVGHQPEPVEEAARPRCRPAWRPARSPTPTTPARAVTPAKVPSRARAASSPRRGRLPAGRPAIAAPPEQEAQQRGAGGRQRPGEAEPAARRRRSRRARCPSPSSTSTAPVSRPTWYTNEPSSVWLSSLVTRQATV